MFKTLTHVCGWVHMTAATAKSFFKWLWNGKESMRHSVGDRRQQSKAPPLCTYAAYLHTYFENWSLMTQTFFFHCIYWYHLTLVIYGSFLSVTQWQMHVTLQRRLGTLSEISKSLNGFQSAYFYAVCRKIALLKIIFLIVETFPLSPKIHKIRKNKNEPKERRGCALV